MAEQKVLIVQNLIAQGTNNSRYMTTHANESNIYALAHQENLDVNGRVISIFDDGGFLGYDSSLANHSYSLTGDNNLMISGNYNQNASDVREFNWKTVDPKLIGWFVQKNDTRISMSTGYNAYHFTFNSWNATQGEADASGAIYFGGNNQLTLTAQAGAENTKFYYQRNGYNESSAKYWKTDDNIKLRSDNFAVYGYIKADNNALEESNGVTLGNLYDTENSGVHIPSKQTENYVIHHAGEAGTALTVTSDLAGEIISNVGAVHTGYMTPKAQDAKYAPSNDDSSSNVIKGAGVKAGNLTLQGNFRATINAKNNAEAMNGATNGATNGDGTLKFTDGTIIADKRKLYGWDPQYETGADGAVSNTLIGFTANGTVWDLTNYGTVIAGFSSTSASNNTIENYGVLVDDGTIELKDGVWSGEINVDTSDVAIIADYNYLRADKSESAVSASATGNVIGAYGVKAGTVNIAKMGALQKDYDGVNAPPENEKNYASSINVTTGHHLVQVRGKGVSKDGKITEGAAAAGVDVYAIALDADTVNIGEVTSDFTFNTTVNGSQYNASIAGAKDKAKPTADPYLHAYGIRATDIAFGSFNGNINVTVEEQEIIGAEQPILIGRHNVFGIKANKLEATNNFGGNINLTVGSNSIEYAGSAIEVDSFTVNGVIDTVIVSERAGIVVKDLSADAFTGSIEVGQGYDSNSSSPAFAVNGGRDFESTISSDAFDMAGFITAGNLGLTSFGELNLRISGTINANGYAVSAGYSYNNIGQSATNPDHQPNDMVELSRTARVTGEIDLGSGENYISFNSNSRLDGVVNSAAGTLQVNFDLDGPQEEDHVVYNVASYSENDAWMKDSVTYSINMGYAENGIYTLADYYISGTSSDNQTISPLEIIKKRDFVINYKNYDPIIMNIAVDDGTDGYANSCKKEIGDSDVSIRVFLENSNGRVKLKAEVSGITDDAKPSALDLTATVNDYVTVAGSDNGKSVIDWSDLDYYLSTQCSCTLEGVKNYGLNLVNAYKLEYWFGNDQDNATTINFHEINGTSYTIDPDGNQEDLHYKITPIENTVIKLGEDKDLQTTINSSISRAGNDTFVFAYSDLKEDLCEKKQGNQSDADYLNGLADWVEIIYTRYRTDGTKIDTASEFMTMAAFVSGNQFTIGDCENMRVEVTVNLHDNNRAQLNNSDAFVTNAANGGSNIDLAGWCYGEYDKENGRLTIDWAELDRNLVTDGHPNSATDGYGFEFNKVEKYEIEYILIDEDGRPLSYLAENADDPKNNDTKITANTEQRVYNTIPSIKVFSTTSSFTFNGLNENMSIAWRMRIVGNTTGSVVSQWSNWDYIKADVKDDERFDLASFHTSVKDAYQTEAGFAINKSIAELSWGGIVSDSAIRNYEVEYVLVDDLVSDIPAGFDRLEDYLASNNFFSGKTVYSKVVSGTSLTISNLGSADFVYWRIRAIDEQADLVDVFDGNGMKEETQKHVSDWVAGQNFRIFTSSSPDKGNPTFPENPVNYFVYSNKPETFGGNTDVRAELFWKAASDNKEAGIASYDVEVYSKGLNINEVPEELRNVFEHQQPNNICKLNLEGVVADGTYVVTVGTMVNGVFVAARHIVLVNGAEEEVDVTMTTIAKNGQLWFVDNKIYGAEWDMTDKVVQISGPGIEPTVFAPKSETNANGFESYTYYKKIIYHAGSQSSQYHMTRFEYSGDDFTLADIDRNFKIEGLTADNNTVSGVEITATWDANANNGDGGIIFTLKYEGDLAALYANNNNSITGWKITGSNYNNDKNNNPTYNDRTSQSITLDGDNFITQENWESYDFTLDLDELDHFIDPDQNYDYRITAKDFAGHETTLSGTVVADKGPGNEQFIEKGNAIGYYVDAEKPLYAGADTFLTGYIGWNKAVDFGGAGGGGIRKYVVSIVDADGNVVKDAHGKECTDFVDVSDDPTSADPTPLTVIEIPWNGFELDGDYTDEITIKDVDGEPVDFETVVKDTGYSIVTLSGGNLVAGQSYEIDGVGSCEAVDENGVITLRFAATGNVNYCEDAQFTGCDMTRESCYSLQLVATGDLRNTSITVGNLDPFQVDADCEVWGADGQTLLGHAKFYNFSVDISQWHLTGDKYQIKLEAVDYHNNKSTVDTREIKNLVADNGKPQFTDSVDAVIERLVPAHFEDDSTTGQRLEVFTPELRGNIVWNKATDDDSEISYYKVIVKQGEGENAVVVKTGIVDLTGGKVRIYNDAFKSVGSVNDYTVSSKSTNNEGYQYWIDVDKGDFVYTFDYTIGSDHFSADLDEVAAIPGTGIMKVCNAAFQEAYGTSEDSHQITLNGKTYTIYRDLGQPADSRYWINVDKQDFSGSYTYSINGQNFTFALPEDFDNSGDYQDIQSMTIFTLSGGDLKHGNIYTIAGQQVRAIKGDNDIVYIKFAGDSNENYCTGDFAGCDSTFQTYEYSFNLDSWRLFGNGYSYEIKAYDYFGKEISANGTISADQTAPEFATADVDTCVKAEAAGLTGLIGWKAASDNSGIKGYRVVITDADGNEIANQLFDLTGSVADGSTSILDKVNTVNGSVELIDGKNVITSINAKNIVTCRDTDLVLGDTYKVTIAGVDSYVMAQADSQGVFLKFETDTNVTANNIAIEYVGNDVVKQGQSFEVSADEIVRYDFTYRIPTALTENGYSYKVTAYDAYGNSTTIYSEESGNLFNDQDLPVVTAPDVYTELESSAIKTDSVLSGYIAWNKAQDATSPIASYTIRLYRPGNTGSGTEQTGPVAIATRTFTVGENALTLNYDNQTSTARSILTIPGDWDLDIDGYRDGDGSYEVTVDGVDCTCTTEVKKIDDDSNVLIITANADLRGKTIEVGENSYFINNDGTLSGTGVDNAKYNFYDYAFDINSIFGNLLEDSYRIEIEATDIKGNTGNVVEHTFVIDGSNPEFTETELASSVRNTVPEHLGEATLLEGVIAWNKATDADNEITHYELEINGEAGSKKIAVTFDLVDEPSSESRTTSIAYSWSTKDTKLKGATRANVYGSNGQLITEAVVRAVGDEFFVSWNSTERITENLTVQPIIEGVNNPPTLDMTNYDYTEVISINAVDDPAGINRSTYTVDKGGNLVAGQIYTISWDGCIENVTAVAKESGNNVVLEWFWQGETDTFNITGASGSFVLTAGTDTVDKHFDFYFDIEDLNLPGGNYNYTLVGYDDRNKETNKLSGSISADKVAPNFSDEYSRDINSDAAINYQWITGENAHSELRGYIGWENATDDSGIRSYTITVKDGDTEVKKAIIAIDSNGNNTHTIVGRFTHSSLKAGEIYTVRFDDAEFSAVAKSDGSSVYLEWSYDGTATHKAGTDNMSVDGFGFDTTHQVTGEEGNTYTEEYHTAAVPVAIARFTNSGLTVGDTYTVTFSDENGVIGTLDVVAGKDEKGTYLNWGVANDRINATEISVVVGNETYAYTIDGTSVKKGNAAVDPAEFTYNKFAYGFDLGQWGLTGTGYTYEITAKDYYENSKTITGNITAEDGKEAYFRGNAGIELGNFVYSTRPENLDAASLMKGYICWNMAVDDYAPIQKYVVELMDGETVIGTHVIDLGENPAENAIPAGNKRFIGSIETNLSVAENADGEFRLYDVVNDCEVNGSMVKAEIITVGDGEDNADYKLVLHYTGNGTLPENAVIQQKVGGSWVGVGYNLSAVTYGYSLNISEIWSDLELSNPGYSFRVTAYDYYQGSSVSEQGVLSQDTIRENGDAPLMQDIANLNNGNFGTYITIDSGKYVDDIAQDPTDVEPTLTGFIGWDKAFDPSVINILKYEVSLVDADGNVIEGYTKTVDLSGNGIDEDAPAMSVMTHRGDYTVGEEYTISWNGGSATVVAQSDSVGAYIRWSAAGSLDGDTAFTLAGNVLTDVSVVKYDYSISIDDWYLPGQRYSYQIKAYDYHGNSSVSDIYNLIADNGNAPKFGAEDVSGHDFSYNENNPAQNLAPGDEGFGFVRGDKDSINSTGIETYLTGEISWGKAEDSQIGVRYYELVMNNEIDGSVTYYIDADGVGYKNTVSFNSIPYSEDIDLENLSITVYINGVEIPGYQLSYTISEGLINFEDLVIYSKEALHLGEESINIVLNEDSGFSGNPANLINFSSVECNLVRIENGRYILDTELLPDQLTRSDYTYEIYAVDKLGNRSEMLASDVEGSSGVIDIDRANPVFGSDPADLITEAIAFTNVVDDQYSATIGWSDATDDVGIHAYRITLTDAKGKTIEKRVLKERTEWDSTSTLRTSGTDYSVAVWRSEDLIIGATYTVTDANGNSWEVIAQERKETINYNLEDGTVQDGVRAQEVVGVRFISWSGEGFNGGNVTITGPNGYSQTISGSLVDTNETYQYANYNNSFTIEGLASGEYSYTIKAEDYFGNLSAPVTGNLVFDNIAPEFFGLTNNVSWVNNQDGSFTPTFTWSKALDGNGGTGVAGYVIQYYVNGEWRNLALIDAADVTGDTITWTAENAISSGVYDYRIIASDKVGNTSILTGQFGSISSTHLTGKFSDCRVEMSAEGEDKDINGNFIDPHVTLSWRYSDPGQVERFRVTVNVGSKSYTFWTDDAYQTFMEFDQTTIGRPVDIFSSNETITWTVDAFDSNKNASFVTSGTQSISSIKQSADGAPAPVDLEVIYGNQVAGDRVNTDIVGVTWNTAHADLGVYYYELTLERLDENGNVVETFTKSTLTTSIPGNANDYLEADINPDLVDIRNYGGNYTSVTIADLRKFFGIANFRDGDYKISVKSFDAQGNSKADAYASTSLTFDTARPGLVNVDMVTAKAFAYNISEEASRQELVIEWKGISDASGIDYYEVQYRPAGSKGSWVTAIVKHVDGPEKQFCVAEVSGETNVKAVEYRITAYDKLGNRGLVWDSYLTIEMVEDKFADTEYTGRVYTDRQFEISDSVGRGDAADCFQFTTTSEETVNFNVIELVGTGLSGNIDGIVIEVYKKTASGFTYIEELEFGAAGSGDVVLEAGTTYSFKIKNADPAGKSSSQYTINVDRASQVIVPGENPGDPDVVVPTDDQPWFNLENFSASVVDTDLSSKGGVITGSATFIWQGMVCGDTADTTGTVDSYTIEYFISDKMLTEDALKKYNWSNADRITATGNSCDVEFSQNGGYVYWRIQGVNEIENSDPALSNWVNGEVFTLGVDKDTTAPEFTDKKVALFDTEVVIPDDAEGIDIKEKATCRGKIRWEAATDSGSSVKEYQIEVFANGAYTLVQTINASDKVIYYDEATKTTYSYLTSFDSNGSASFRYRIKAVDFSGNPSGYVYGEWTGDKGAPLFFNENVEVSVTKNTTGSAIIPTLKWTAAVDHSGDQGIRYYEVRVATEFSSNWEYTMLVPAGENSDYEVTLDNLNLVPGNYVFEVVAVDYFGNRSAGRDNPSEAVVDGSASGSFSTPDTTAPFGVFTFGQGNVFATYKTKYLGSDGKLYDEIPETSEGDQEESEEDTIEYQEIKTLVDASVTLNWDDNFTDIDHYKVVVSNKPLTADQQEDAITYDFIVDGIQLVFDNETTGRPVGIFQGMKKVYVNIFAYDASGNVASSVCSYDFDFNNYDGTWVDLSKMSGSIATPGRVNVSAGDLIDGVYSDKITLKWSTNAAHTGVYYYAVELKSKDGKTVYKGDTLNKDAAHDTDMKEDNSFYNVRSESVAVGSDENAATVQRTIVEISDLKKFFNVPDIIDGEYTLTITAYDGNGKAGTPYKHYEPILIDTQRPTQVQVTKYGVNTNEVEGVDTNIVYFNWLPSTDASGIAGYIIEYGEAGGTITRKTVDAKANSYEFPMGYNDNVDVVFRVSAVDKKGNVSTTSEWITVQKTPDLYSHDVKAPKEIEFNANNTASVADIVGKSDIADCFCFTTGSASETLILNVSELGCEFGKNQKIKIDIYEGENTNRIWKSYTVSEISRVFGDLLLKADTKYTFKVTNTDKSSVSKYAMVLERAPLQANTADDKFNNEGTRDTITVTQGERDFVGYGDTIDYRDVVLSASGKYTFTLNNVAASTKLTVYEKVWDAKKGDYRLVSLGAVTATASSFAGVTTKELLLDDSKMYVVGISATNTKIYGSEYDLSMNLVESESYPDGDESKATLVLGDTVANGWVGFGDASDDYSFTAGTNGSVVNFTINHNGDETGAVKLEIYNTATNKRVGTYTLKAGAAGISTGNLYFVSGSYRVTVIATGAAKVQNSDYELTVNGYDIGNDVESTDNIVSATGLPELFVAGDQLERFVGVGDTVDNFKISEQISAEEVYQFKLSGTNGKEIKAAVGYINSKGKFVALTTVTGTAGSDELIISRKFTQADIDKAGTDGFFVQVTANGKNANSQYDLEMVKIDSTLAGFNNADDKILTAKQAEKDTFNYEYGTLSTSTPVSDWVGLGDASDYWKLSLSADGMYDLNIDGIENPVKVTLYQVVKNAAGDITSYTTLKSVTVNAVNASAVMSNLLLNDAAEYYVGITATGAAKGQNSEYTLTLNQAATQAGGTLDFGAADQEISATGTNWIINAPTAGGAFNFTLDAKDIEGGNVKLTVYELLTNGKTRTVKSITVKPGAEGSTGNLYIAADAVSNGTGIYQIEVKGVNAKSSGNFDLNVESFYFANADSAQWVGQFGNFTDKDLITAPGEGVYSINLTDIDGNNIKVSILDANGKVVKSFVPAANSTSATFSYAFKDGYQIEFAANGKNKCSEYDWELVERAADTGNDSIDKILNESAVALGEGWVGSNDKTDCFNLGQNAAGYYNLDFEDNLQNDLKVTVYEYDASGSKVKQKSVRSVTLKAGSGNYSLENLLLDGSKNYYVMVQATNTNGTKDTVYNWNLSNNETFIYTTNDDVRETTAASISSDSSVDGWVGYGDAVDCYSFVAGNGAVDFNLMFNGTADGNVTLKIYDSVTRKQVGKTLTINSKTPGISTGDLCFVYGREYYLEVKASNAAKGQSASYTLSNTFWEFDGLLADSQIVNKVVLPTDKAPVLDFDFATAVVSGAVWNTADSKNEVDWYKFTVSGKNDSYTLNLSNINGNNVKVSIGYIENGKFKVVQSVTGKAGAEILQFTRELGTRDYYVKIETTGINRASEYKLELTCNNDLAGFDTNDNTWKQVAANVPAKTYEVGETIENWVGFGDTVDVFKIETDENGRLVFGGYDDDDVKALRSQEIKLSLMDLNGKSVKLTFDKSTGEYTTGVNLLADTEYFLSVTSSKPKNQNTDYSIAIDKR